MNDYGNEALIFIMLIVSIIVFIAETRQPPTKMG